eukprot:1099010-Rhodomonas_salina.1
MIGLCDQHKSNWKIQDSEDSLHVPACGASSFASACHKTNAAQAASGCLRVVAPVETDACSGPQAPRLRVTETGGRDPLESCSTTWLHNTMSYVSARQPSPDPICESRGSSERFGKGFSDLGSALA